MRAIGRTAAGLTMTGAVLGLVTGIGAGTAMADTVSTTYSCAAGGQTLEVTEKITITAPATANTGDTVTLQVAVEHGTKTTGTVPAKSVTAQMVVTVGGAGSGAVTATGLTNPEEIPQGTVPVLSGGTAQVSLSAPGDVTFTPSELTVDNGGLKATCSPIGSVAAAATTHVS
ncbi:hypothetical protein [Streptomyces sp. NPDC059142]|uniref:hypothetical protein n=1 Tax=Streptomyces sp. NPDC059142 TaxID=3346739 RepID=UPI0036CC5FA4